MHRESLGNLDLNFLLQLRNELWKLFGKKRTYIGFAMFLLTQNIVSIVFRFTKASQFMYRMLEGNGYLVEPYLSALTISTIMLFPIAAFLLPLYVSLVGGDLVAKEAEDGTLRMILARPVSRARLILLKWLAGVIFSTLLVAALGRWAYSDCSLEGFGFTGAAFSSGCQNRIFSASLILVPG